MSSDSLKEILNTPEPLKTNDTLNALAALISGTWNGEEIFKNVGTTKAYLEFSEDFNNRWKDYDSTRIRTLMDFRNKELAGRFGESKTLFYPFSGPDILYPSVFFPGSKKFILLGLEPVGTFPDFNKPAKDSLREYYGQLNKALFAILRFSFFRTESMRQDLKSGELDGVIHLLFLFLNRTGNTIISARAITIDSTGNKLHVGTFEQLASSKLKTKGVEIIFADRSGEIKELDYFSLNAVDYELKKNKGILHYISNEKNINVYLKGASYLLHKPYFSLVRNSILNLADAVVQDDSGIAMRYFLNDTAKWDFTLYGEYSKPIATFARQYQYSLDSLYKTTSTKKLSFGLGYNYRDKNSNFMIATKHKQ